MGLFRGGDLYYPTDAVMENNAIYRINIDTKCIQKIQDINGSCIYAVTNNNDFFFSTTVEPIEGKKGYMDKLGTGIKSRYSYLMHISASKINTIIKFRKDLYPMRLFQYGCVQFPKGQNFPDKVICYGVGLNKIDGKNIMIKIV